MRRVLLRLVAVTLGFVGALLLAEVAVRSVLPPPERVRIVASNHAERLRQENEQPTTLRGKNSVDDDSTGGHLYFHTPTGMRLRANTRAVIENHRLGGLDVEIQTNSLGYRNRELGPKERPRILFLGDSITVQDYLPEQQTIVRRVEALSAATDEPLETVNAGVGAVGLATELAILQETGFATDPDAIALNWYLNDVQASAGVELVEPEGLLAQSRLAELLLASIAGLEPNRRRSDLSTIPPEIDAQWRAELEARLPSRPGNVATDPRAFNQRVKDLVFDWGSAWADGAWTRMTPLFVEMKRQADLRGLPLFIVAFPVREQVVATRVRDYPQRRLREIADALGVPMLDLLPILRQKYRREHRPLYFDWCHPSPLGSEVIAAAILEFLQREL